jgi:uncharacterized membrane protein YdjX (TVP38/TMEM64 family)
METRVSKFLGRIWPLLLIAVVIGAVFATGANRWLSLDALREHDAQLHAYVDVHPILSLAAFVAIYVVATAAYLPGASILTIAGGFLFGTWVGGSATVVGATLGALGAYWLVRTALGEPLRHKAEQSPGALQKIAEGIRKDAFAYTLSLRLIPAVPFWLLNAAAGLVSAPVRPYTLATLIGIMPATFIYSGIGAGLGQLFRAGRRPDLSIIFEPHVLYPLIGLGLLSLIPAIVRRLRGRKEPAA